MTTNTTPGSSQSRQSQPTKANSTMSPATINRLKTVPSRNMPDSDGGLLAKAVALILLALGSSEAIKIFVPFSFPWFPPLLTILTGALAAIAGVRLAIQQRQAVQRQLTENLAIRKRLEETQQNLLERTKQLEHTNREIVQKAESFQRAEITLRHEHTALVARAQEDAAALARASVTLQTESSARARLEQEIQQIKTAMAEANQVKSEFLANISHELRTPLNGVIGMTKLLLDTELTPEQQDYAEAVRHSADLLHTVTNSLFDFSELEGGNLELEETDFELPRMIEGIIDLFSETASKKQLELSSFIHDDVPLNFRGDAGRLRQVLLILVGNALKFTETGAVSIQSNILHQTATHVTLRFSIHDTGIGIPEDRLPKLFQPFFQVDASSTRKYGGAGLGLALSKKLVELMGGVIGVESTLGKGSLFWFTLPLRKQHAGAEALSVSLSRKKGAVPVAELSTQTKPRILVAEDNLVNQKLVSRLLEKMGYDVRLVFNGQEAVLAVEQGAYAAILMDCQMPVMDGLVATETIRARETAHHLRHTPIIALTAHVIAGDKERCLAAGMDDYLSKPLNPDKLKPALTYWLQQFPPPSEAFLRLSSPDSDSQDSVLSSATAERSFSEETKGRPTFTIAGSSANTSASLSSPPLFDLTEALARVGGDRELLGELAEIFLESCPTYLANVQKALAQGDVQALSLAAHALKGSVGNFTKSGPFETARALELLGRQGTLAGTGELFKQLEKEITSLQPTLESLRLEAAA